MPSRRINEIVQGKCSISTDTTLQLSRAFGTSDQFWLKLQNRYDLDVVMSEHGSYFNEIVPLVSA